MKILNIEDGIFSISIHFGRAVSMVMIQKFAENYSIGLVRPMRSFILCLLIESVLPKLDPQM